MSVYKPKNAKHYLFDFRRSGRRFHGSTHQAERRTAEAVERDEIRKAEAEVAKGVRRKNGPMTFNAAAGRYWAEVGAHTTTARETERNLERLVEWIGASTPLTEITDDVVAQLVARRRGDTRVNAARKKRRGRAPLGRVSNGQVNRSVTELLRRVMTRARKVWKVALPDEPDWRAHRLPEPRERVRELRHDEEERLEEVERDDYRAPRLFAQITGLRRREVTSLTWAQVDFAAEVIRVVGKGDKPHKIPLTPELHALLWPLRDQHETAVFTYVCRRTRVCATSKRKLVRGQRYPITYNGFSTHMRRGFAKAGIADFRVHDLRHTSATRMLRASGNLKLVQKLLNHSSPSVTEKYAHADLDDLRRAMLDTAVDTAARRANSREKSRDDMEPRAQPVVRK